MTKRKNLLSASADAKTVKGEKLGYLTGILYLSPANESGASNLCKHASAGCKAVCLYTAGRGAFSNVASARLAKTLHFLGNRNEFWKDLIWSIEALIRKAERLGMIPAIRLNGTSDIPWERMPVVIDGDLYAKTIFDAFPTVQFYDYTKYPISRRRNLPSNYDLTFSLSEDNQSDAFEALALGVRVAIVFNTKKGQDLPKTHFYGGYEVIDGDDTDLRFLESGGVIVGLRAKGSARKDTSGFVQAPMAQPLQKVA
jgi:hypothetical protein